MLHLEDENDDDPEDPNGPDDPNEGGDDSPPAAPVAPPYVYQIPPVRVFLIKYVDPSDETKKDSVKTAGHMIAFPHNDVVVVYEYVDGPEGSNAILQVFRRAVRGYYDVQEIMSVENNTIQ